MKENSGIRVSNPDNAQVTTFLPNTDGEGVNKFRKEGK